MSQMISRGTDIQIPIRGGVPQRWTSGHLMAAPLGLFRLVRRLWTVRTDERLLRDLSDHQLRDIGIRREHIAHIVRKGWDG